MIKEWKTRRTILLAVFALLAAVAAGTFLPGAEAADCGGSAGGMSNEWVATAEAQARTAAGECGASAVCREWCVVACGEPHPQGVFECFPR